MLLEIGHDQGQLIMDLADATGFECEVLKDLAGHDRTAVCRKKQ